MEIEISDKHAKMLNIMGLHEDENKRHNGI